MIYKLNPPNITANEVAARFARANGDESPRDYGRNRILSLIRILEAAGFIRRDIAAALNSIGCVTLTKRVPWSGFSVGVEANTMTRKALNSSESAILDGTSEKVQQDQTPTLLEGMETLRGTRSDSRRRVVETILEIATSTTLSRTAKEVSIERLIQ